MPAWATFSFVAEAGVRDLGQRLAEEQRARHDLVITQVQVPLDHEAALHTLVLRGRVREIHAFVDAIATQRGVRHDSLSIIPAQIEVVDHPHGHAPQSTRAYPDVTMRALDPTRAPVRRRLTRPPHRTRSGTGLALAAVLSAGTPVGEARAQESVALDELSVEAVGTGAPAGTTTAAGTIGQIGPTPGFGAGRAVSSTKIDTPQLDVPQVVSVAPREVITDLAATRVDRCSTTCRASRATEQLRRPEHLQLRHPRGDHLGDLPERLPPQPRHAAPARRAEHRAHRGSERPWRRLFGRSDPGGLVNIITKQPTAQRFVEFGNQVDSFGLTRGTVDAVGPLNEDGTVLYRFNFAAQGAGSFRDFVDSDRLLVAPVVSWQITPDTRITVEADIQRNRIIFDRGVIAINKQLGFLPISRFLGEPGQSTYQSQNILQARIDHRFKRGLADAAGDALRHRNPGRRVCRDPLYRLRQPDGGPRPERARLSLGRRGRAGGPDRALRHRRDQPHAASRL